MIGLKWIYWENKFLNWNKAIKNLHSIEIKEKKSKGYRRLVFDEIGKFTFIIWVEKE